VTSTKVGTVVDGVSTGGGGGGAGAAAGAFCTGRGFPDDGVAGLGAGVLGAGWEADSMNTSATYNVPLAFTTPTPMDWNPGSVRLA
jgi:hypothetical protein